MACDEANVPSERSESRDAPFMPFVYMIKDRFGKLYVGVSKNPQSRLKEHNTRRGSIFTKSGNFKVVFEEEYPTLVEARQREIQIKKWRREKKEMLIGRYQDNLPTKN